MSARTLLATITFTCAVLFPATAHAHVTLQPEEAPAGEFTRLDVRVPNERDDASTEKVDVRFPSGFFFVSTEPIAGWTARVTRKRLAKPTKVLGETARDQVARLTLTAQQGAAKIGPGEFRDFGLSVLVPDTPGRSLTFKALQTYDNGEVVRWIGPPDAEEPAPQVKVVRASEATQPRESGGDEDSEGLAIAALIVGGLGLLGALAAMAIARRHA
jgi:uncharacterized protein